MSPDRLRARYPALTARQAEVVDLYDRGLSLNRIALTLGLDRSTVRGHLAAATRRIVAAERRAS